MVAPEEGWDRLKRLIQTEEARAVVQRLRALHSHHYGPDANFNSWPASQLEELEKLLFKTFPPEEDPCWATEEAPPRGVDDELRSLRGWLPSLLYQRDEEGDREVLEQLANAIPRIREWLDDVLIHQGAEGVLAGFGRGTRPPGVGRKVPVPLMVKLLRDSQFRVVGTVDDLQDVILEQLKLISNEAKQHLSMLYRPREKSQKRKHLHEDALQSYISCRLTDKLPSILAAQGLKIVIDRETLAARNHKNDLRIQARSYDDDRLLVLIVEIKWSDNADVSTSQVDQLAKDYLLENDLTHGIYLVGWSGIFESWKPEALGEPPDPCSSPEAWQRALKAQAELFSAEARQLRIESLVMDLTWDREELLSGV